MRTLADSNQLTGLVQQLTIAIEHQITRAGPEHPWAIVGIRSRGDLLATRLHEQLASTQMQDRLGVLDITLYRDDLSEINRQPVVRTTEIPFNLDGLNVVLVDDVLMTGRSIRAALQSLMDLGRPKRVWLAVLVDRGGRELPIAPDFTALDLTNEASLSAEDIVEVNLLPLDQTDGIVVQARQTAEKEVTP